MVVWCTQHVRQDGASFTWHQPYDNSHLFENARTGRARESYSSVVTNWLNKLFWRKYSERSESCLSPAVSESSPHSKTMNIFKSHFPFVQDIENMHSFALHLVIRFINTLKKHVMEKQCPSQIANQNWKYYTSWFSSSRWKSVQSKGLTLVAVANGLQAVLLTSLVSLSVMFMFQSLNLQFRLRLRLLLVRIVQKSTRTRVHVRCVCVCVCVCVCARSGKWVLHCLVCSFKIRLMQRPFGGLL